MSIEPTLMLDFSEEGATSQVLPRLPILSSHQFGWKHLHLNHFHMPAWEVPEIESEQHTLSLFSPKSQAVTEIFLEGKFCPFPQFERDHLLLIPKELPFSSRWLSAIDITTCHLDARFVDRIAYESVNPERVELMPAIPPHGDLFVCQLVMALQHVLETAPNNSSFYAESLATALAAHLIQFYATRTQTLRQYRGGLPQHKLNQAIEYINAHLSEDISLAAISDELNISHYYLCRLFKQSMGISPHKYLTQQRVERSKQLLKCKEMQMLDIASACGFANPSHFAKCFRQQLGISPRQFQRI